MGPGWLCSPDIKKWFPSSIPGLGACIAKTWFFPRSVHITAGAPLPTETLAAPANVVAFPEDHLRVSHAAAEHHELLQKRVMWFRRTHLFILQVKSWQMVRIESSHRLFKLESIEDSFFSVQSSCVIFTERHLMFSVTLIKPHFF